MTDFVITGAEQLQRLTRRIRDSGDKNLRRELAKALNRATKKPKADARANARQRLPRRGGLAELVAKSKLSTRNRTQGRGNPVLQIVAVNQDNIRNINAGTVRHPVFGHHDRWVNQPVTKGWFSDAMKGAAPEVRKELAVALSELERKLSSH